MTQSGGRTLAPGPQPLDNPLKGFAAYANPGDSHALPVSMAYFYRSWRELEPTRGNYAFSAWEALWDNPAARGKHVVLRVYLDYPSLPSGVPDWVMGSGVKTTAYTDHGGGQSPDYDDPRLLGPLLDFLAAFGARYDRNPRVAFVALGTLGFWGEWHTYPRSALFASPATQRAVVAAYRRAFANVPLLARYPYAETSLPWLGYHDDLFPDDTDNGQDWGFLAKMRAAGRQDNWKVAPIGAEMVPNQAPLYLGEKWAQTRDTAAKMHLSWIGPYCPANARDLDPAARAHGEALLRSLGYAFRLTEYAWRRDGRDIVVTVDGVNDGVAPFYRPWSIELTWLDILDRPVRPVTAVADPRRFVPGPFTITARLPAPPPGRPSRLAVGIRDPWQQRPAVGFGNALPRIDGWTVLGALA